MLGSLDKAIAKFDDNMKSFFQKLDSINNNLTKVISVLEKIEKNTKVK